MEELSSTGTELQAAVASGLNMWGAPEGDGAAARAGGGTARAGDPMKT